MKKATEFAREHQAQFVDELIALLRIPSVSTDPSYAEHIRSCANWLKDHLADMRINHTEIIETAGHPLVYGEHLTDEALPTVLVYGHYDVQPPDPLDLWESQPFEPEIRDNVIFARGSSDDKGQCFLILKAIQSLMQTRERLPCNLKILLEGEEECGSVNIKKYVAANSEKLAADIALVCDTGMIAADKPAITTSLRGMIYTELLLKGPNRDLHSGVYGGAVDNPLHVISSLLASLHDGDHRVTIPGFYDAVVELSDAERSMLRELPFDEKGWLEEIAVANVNTEAGYSVLEATTARPTLEVNGIWGGYMEAGSKTVIPAGAGAKISCRLVANQDPDEIFAALDAYFRDRMPDTVDHTFRQMAGGAPVSIDFRHPAIGAAAEAMAEAFDSKVHFVRIGGSIPVVAEFKTKLQLDSVMMGFGLESDWIHSPNEHFGLDRFQKGIESVIMFLENYGKIASEG